MLLQLVLVILKNYLLTTHKRNIQGDRVSHTRGTVTCGLDW